MEPSNSTASPKKPVVHTTRVLLGTSARSWAKPLGRKAVEKILEQTGSEFVTSPIDIEQLAQELGNCGFWLMLMYYSLSSSRRRISEQRKFLRQVKKQAELLRESIVRSANGRWFKENRNLADRAALLFNDVDHQITDLQDSGLPTSPVEWLVGAHLPEIYENFLKWPAGISRDRKEHSPQGPYLRFARETLRALRITHKGQEYSDETIARAFARNKSLAAAAKIAAEGSASVA